MNKFNFIYLIFFSILMNRNLIFIHRNEYNSAISVHLRFDFCVSPIENMTKNRNFDR